MRISDWSSDVCSSDLHDDPDEAEPGNLLGPDVARDEIDVAGENLQYHRHDQQRDKRRDGDAQNTVDGVEQPCQERGHGAGRPIRDRKSVVSGKMCTYVSISVVAVSLKTKKRNKKNS